MFARYYVWDTQVTCSDRLAHSPCTTQSRRDITGGVTLHAAQVCASVESIPVDENFYYVSVDPYLYTYTEEQILIFIGQIVEAENLLCDIDQQHQD